MCLKRLFGRRNGVKNGYLNLTCTKCGSSVDTDLEHIQVYCPFCGHEMVVGAGVFKDLYEKSKDKK